MPFPTNSIDLHQHWWSPELRDALASLGLLRGSAGTTLHLDGEPPFELDLAAQDLAARRAQDVADGIALTLYSLSSPLGLESRRPDEARRVLDAWHAGAAALPEGTGLWAAAGLVEPDPESLRADLARPGVVGLQVPATALATPQALEALAPLLAVAERAGRPVLVHPGPAAPIPHAAALPSWWPAVTDYVAQLQAAWFAWHVGGRALLPDLRIAFVALAGLAPLLHERLAQRGGRLGAIDPGVFYETSSFGPRAIDAVVRVVGVDPLVHGSDRPYAEPTDPGLGAAFAGSLFVSNPARLLEGGTR
ncbi:amidohydrolase [Nocardioides sp. TRM66260-LWL]|uniref:amidohydrolase family protein n=1 Tax=Nocardioides sp. TRM66260-LWL TaxID=2874478 RepID=UPI001CC7CF0D|nr:amidohydrolase family protein [Nocardioides sp. TRM66260-LWL]MBZ5735761.1 amidohydrolase [Nocardioides sp. TRM66260-LWL]